MAEQRQAAVTNERSSRGPRNGKQLNILRGAALLSLIAGGRLAARAWRERRAIDFSDKTVVIFGGSRGLGLVIARELAAEGARVVLAARNVDELERARLDLEARGARVSTLACDIRRSRDVDNAVARVVADYGRIDVLINDAGIIQVGPFDHATLADFEDAMATHFWGPLFTTLAVLPHMRGGGARRIVNISSIGGRIALPHLLPYSASKFALTGLSEGLHAELAREGIRVTTVCPGLMRTGSTYNAWFKGRHRHEFAWFHLADSIPGLSIDATRAARRIVESMSLRRCGAYDHAVCATGDGHQRDMPARDGVVDVARQSDPSIGDVIGWRQGAFGLAKRFASGSVSAHRAFRSGEREQQRVADGFDRTGSRAKLTWSRTASPQRYHPVDLSASARLP